MVDANDLAARFLAVGAVANEPVLAMAIARSK